MSVKPISPKDVTDNLDKVIPEKIIEAVNNLIKKDFRKHSVTIMQEDILKEIKRLDKGLTEKKVIDNNWLDFEPIFKKAGWIVTYDSPGWDENYDSTFTFKVKQ